MRRSDLKVLIVGGGGREHALAWKVAASPRVSRIFCAPGNAGTAGIGGNLHLKVTDFDGIVAACRKHRVDLVIVGPETPLIAGIADRLESEGIAVFGPSAAASQLEGSKVFTKELLRESRIPSAEFHAFSDSEAACASAREHFSSSSDALVVKADGEAAGKGVIIAGDYAEAADAIYKIMVERAFGASGDRVVLEEFLTGEEASIMAIVDGDSVKGLLPAQDYKRALDGDEGPNTGGMGCYSPVPAVTPEVYEFVVGRIIRPTISALAVRGIRYRGVLYAGVMLTPDGPKLLEYNCRFGDPETQVVLPLMESDLIDIIEAALEGRLDEIELRWYNRKAVCVVMAAGGYPGAYRKGDRIDGVADAEALGALVFHAGTAEKDGAVVTSGGRVLGVTATGADYRESIQCAYAGVGKIAFDDARFRKDIGARVL